MLDSLSEVTVKTGMFERLVYPQQGRGSIWLMGSMTDQLLGKEFIQPVFISCDPARDTVAQVKRYVSGKCRQTLFWQDLDFPGLWQCELILLLVLSCRWLEFHPRMIGLTGPFEAVKQACKAYRVYFSTPPDAKPTEDYLVDHRWVHQTSATLSIHMDGSSLFALLRTLSIFFYLMDSDGQFVDAFGKNSTSPEITAKVMDHVEKWKAAGRSI
jgi:protein SCO1/2